ncbi:MAG: glycosyltransferase [Bacteroidales bacterium]|nr:glycosyltransferase [Bacteroidales bacterium]
MSGIFAIVPAYVPSHVMLDVVHGLSELDIIEGIIVVNDGKHQNTQETVSIFKEAATISKVTVLSHAINCGKGEAIKTAFNYLLCEYPGIIGAVTVDADGQHLPKDVKKVAQAFLESPDDYVLGVRDFHNADHPIPLRSRFGNIITEQVFKFFTRIHLSDTQTGLRCYPRQFMLKCLEITSSRYEFELEALIVFSKTGHHIIQIPIETVYEENNPSSHFNPLIDSFKIYFVFVRFAGASFFCSIIDYLVFSLLLLLGSGILYSLIFARIISVSVNFVLAKKAVFHAGGNAFGQCLKFFILALFLITSSYYLISFLSEHDIMSPFISKILVESTLFLASFVIQNVLIFKTNDNA